MLKKSDLITNNKYLYHAFHPSDTPACKQAYLCTLLGGQKCWIRKKQGRREAIAHFYMLHESSTPVMQWATALPGNKKANRFLSDHHPWILNWISATCVKATLQPCPAPLLFHLPSNQDDVSPEQNLTTSTAHPTAAPTPHPRQLNDSTKPTVTSVQRQVIKPTSVKLPASRHSHS